MKRNETDNLKKISNYQYDTIFDIHKDESGYYYYNMYNSVHVPEDISPAYYDEHIFQIGDFWTKLSEQYYGNKKLWWVILISNNIINPLKLPEAGTKLKILKPEVVQSILLQTINQ